VLNDASSVIITVRSNPRAYSIARRDPSGGKFARVRYCDNAGILHLPISTSSCRCFPGDCTDWKELALRSLSLLDHETRNRWIVVDGSVLSMLNTCPSSSNHGSMVAIVSCIPVGSRK
jgi:hypothetical protein